MIHARSLGRARHEFRFGGRELAILGAVFCLIATLVFAAGVMVGREMARAKGAGRAEIGREHHSPEPDGLRGPETPVKTAAAKAEEKVTFYRTLTAPTQDLPQVGKPTIEERLIPKEDGAPAAAVDAAPATPRPEADPSVAAVKPSKPAEAAPAPRPARPAKAPPASPARPPQQVASAASPSDTDAAWTVQVSAFRSRSLAEELRSRLAARGYEAYVSPAMSEDGRPRYRVRVGAYAARGDAERAAADLRGERGLSPVVTQRTR